MNKYEMDLNRVLDKINIKELNKKRILILGASGTVGRACAEILIKACKEYNYECCLILAARNKEYLEELFCEFKKSNFVQILQLDICNKIIINEDIDIIIDAASDSEPVVYASDPVGVMKTNLLGTINVLELAKNKNSILIFLSSGEVYGEAGYSLEENILNVQSDDVRSCYPISKIGGESLCVSYYHQYNVKSIIIRLSHVYGPTMKKNDSRAVCQFIRGAVKEKTIIMKSDGEQRRNYCYVVDVIYGILYLCLYGKFGEIYNIAGKDIVTLYDLAKIISQITNSVIIKCKASYYEKKGFTKIKNAVLLTNKAKEIGWEPMYSIEEGMEHTIDTIVKNE